VTSIFPAKDKGRLGARATQTLNISEVVQNQVPDVVEKFAFETAKISSIENVYLKARTSIVGLPDAKFF